MPETLKGCIDKVLPGGLGMVQHAQHNALIPNTVAGDHIRYQLTHKKRGVWRGKVVEVLEPSPMRVSPPCPVADACGGCALQPMDIVAQAKLKATWVLDAFSSVITETTDIIPLQTQNQTQAQTQRHTTFAGRRRVRWFVQDGKLGFYQRESHRIAHTHTCMALTPELDTLRNQLEACGLPDEVQSIQAVALHQGIHIILESEHSAPHGFAPQTSEEQQWWWHQQRAGSIKPLHKPVKMLFDHIALPKQQSLDIAIGATDFVQGHAQGNQALVEQILGWAQGSKRIADLFSGCGNLSLPLAKALGAKVVGAELNPASVKAANANAKRLGLDASYQAINLFRPFDMEAFTNADTLILDPPRKGAKYICEHIQQLFAKRIIMVNCDVASGARDAKALANAGFKLQALRPLDLFPYAGHVEALSLWVPA